MGGGGLDNLQRSLPTQPWSAPASFGASPSRTVFMEGTGRAGGVVLRG